MHTASSSHIDEVIARTSARHHDTPADADDLIIRSWARCVNDHGLDPARAQPARIIESAHLREHQEQIESFLRVARAGMEQLYQRVAPLGYVLLLTDRKGVTVDYIGNGQWDRELKRSGLCLGSDWNETHAGTCGVGTCIIERVPLTCHQGDHFDVAHIPLTCTTAPLFDPTGEFIGVLDISALTSPSDKASQHLARHLTIIYAQKVEDANFLRHFADKWILRLGADWALVDVSGECMLAFDADGRIVGANSGARQMLMPPEADGCVQPLVGLHLSDVFETNMDDVWRLARAGTTSARTVLNTRHRELLYAMATPPRHARPMPSHDRQRHGAAAQAAPSNCAALDQFAGDDPPMRRLIDQAKRLVNKKLHILLHGETGTGKEVLARALHDSSTYARKPFVAVNCAAIPESLIESELFGYTAGSFTGARSKGARGLILQADGGTLFLDEIGDMPLHLQTRLLRVLSEHEITPLGAQAPIAVDLMVVAASHRDLRQLIAEGLFREDLYYRLCGATLYLPPLRMRTDKKFVIDRMLRQESERLGLDAQLSQAALALLLDFDWPGNLRQLRNVLRFALAISEDAYIGTDDLPQELITREPGEPVLPAAPPAATGAFADASLQAAAAGQTPAAEKLLAALRQHRWNVTAAARSLGLCRSTVYRQMKRYDIVSPIDQ